MDATSELLREMVAIESLTSLPNARIADFMSERLEELGFEVRSCPYQDLHGVAKVALAARREPQRRNHSGRSVGYFCHNDVVSIEGWNCPHGGPFDAAVAEGKIWGRGTCDMKGSAAAALTALAQIDATEQSAPLYYFVTGDEECGMEGARRLAAEDDFFAELSAAGGVGVIGEPTSLRVVNAHKGGCHFDVTSRGVAAHSSTADGRNANWQLIPFLNYLSGVQRRMEEAGELVNRQFDPPTMSPNLVLENHPCSPNITVGKAVCSLFFRPMPDTAWEKLVEEIQQTAEQMGLEVQLLPPLPPLHTPADRPSVRETLRLLGQSAPQTVCYATDGCCFHSLSDLIVLGPGSIEQAHRPDEWIAIAELQRGREVFEQQFRHFACL